MQRHERGGGGEAPQQRFNERSGPYSSGPRRRGPPPRRSYDQQTPQQQANYDPASNVKHKTVKLGDQPDRLLAKMRETGSLLDSFLSHDYRTYLNSVFNEVPSAGVDKAGLAAYFKQQALLTCEANLNRLPSVAIVLKLFVDCIAKLPHKHSYYVCLLWYMLHETLGGNPRVGLVKAADEGEEAEVKSVAAEFAEIFYKFATVRVKGESAADEVEVVALVDKPGGISIPVKFEANDQRHLEYQDRAPFIMILIVRIQDLLAARVRDILRSRYGIQHLPELYGALRGLADFVNVGLLDAGSFLQLCQALVPDTTASADHLHVMMTLAGTSLMWLNAAIYEEHKTVIDDMIATILRVCQAHNANPEVVVLTRAISSSHTYSVENPKMLADNVELRSNLKFFADALTSLQSRSWVSKSLPRLYESAKLKDLHRRECNIPVLLAKVTPFTINWPEFSVYCYRYRYPARFGPELAAQAAAAPLWRVPKCELIWREETLTHEPLGVLNEAYQNQEIEVELMKPCDVFILRIYVTQTIQLFLQDLDLCAETLLLIPCRHDQFTLILLDQIFEIAFSPTPSLQGLSLSNVMDGLLLAQLLRRLCILEKSLVRHVLHAIAAVLQKAATLSELAVTVLVDFLSAWITSHDEEHVNNVCNIFLTFPELEGCPTNADLSTPLDVAYKNAASTLPLSAVLRITALVIYKVQRMSSRAIFERKIPPYLRKLCPATRDFDAYAEVLFCKVDNEDSSRCRIPADLEQMERLHIDAKAPLEAVLLRDLLRLQIVGGRREQVILVNECVALLRDLVGTGFIQSLREFSRNEQDELLFRGMVDPYPAAAVRGGSLKVEAPPIVKSEMGEGASALDSGADLQLVGAAGGPGGVDSGEIVAELELKSLILQQTFPRFDQASSSWKWTVRRVSRLFSLVLHTVGARTFSHFQKALEHYTPAIKGWKMYLSRTREEDETMGEHEERSEVLAFEYMLVDHTLDLLWRRTNNVTRVWHTLAHLVNRDCVSLHSLITCLLRDDLLLHTIGGDYILWELVDLCVNNVSATPSYSSEAITKNVMREYRRSHGSAPPVRKVEEMEGGDVKSELQGATAAVAAAPEVSSVVQKLEDEPNMKLSQEDLFQLLELLVCGCLGKPNSLSQGRLVRLVRVAESHLSATLFQQFLDKTTSCTEDPIVQQIAGVYVRRAN